MSQYRNARSQNLVLDYGNILKTFEKMRTMIAVNDGTRSFTYRTVDAHDLSCPFTQGQPSQINLTHSDHFISDVDKGFINAHIKQTLKLNTNTEWKSQVYDYGNILKIFNGLKDSNQVFDRLEILHNNVNVGYQQNEMIREGFLYGVQKPEAEKKRRRFIHTLWENVCKYSQTICGNYINLNEFKAEVATVKSTTEQDPLVTGELLTATQKIANVSKLKKRFTQIGNEAIIPSKFIMHLKATGKYNTSTPIEIDDDLTDDFFSSLTTPISPTYDVQEIVKAKYTGVTSIDELKVEWDCKYETQPATLTYQEFTITLMKSNMQGYGCTEATKQGITEILRQGIIIPSQQVDYHAFPIAASANGIKSSINIPLMNVTTMSLLFPKYSNELTVFENPCYQNCYLNVAGTNYPDENLSTNDPRFYEMQLEAADLDGITLMCTKDFEDSITMTRNHEETGKRFVNTLSDATNFVFQIKTERSGGGFFYDGLDSNGGNVQIQVNGQPIYTGVDDTYYNVDESGTIHPPPIQLWLTRDTYFTLNLNGLEYHDKTTPEGSQAESTNPRAKIIY